MDETQSGAEDDAAIRNREHKALDFRLTVGLRKIDRQWTITHERHSVPAVD
jgi:hypothetical protein